MDNVRTGRLIAGLRKQKERTQQELADRMNLSNKTISKWESSAVLGVVAYSRGWLG